MKGQCVLCCHPIYSRRHICGRISRGHTGGRSYRTYPPFFCVLLLIFIARRIQPYLSLVDREVEFCVRTINRSPLFGHDICTYLFFLFQLTSQRHKGSRLTTELPERPMYMFPNQFIIYLVGQMRHNLKSEVCLTPPNIKIACNGVL